MPKVSKQRREECIERLRELAPEGSTVYCVLRYVSASGMSRGIDLYAIQDNQPRWLSRFAADALGCRFNEKRECLAVSGCGMDMGLHVVSELSYRLYGKGTALSHRWM